MPPEAETSEEDAELAAVASLLPTIPNVRADLPDRFAQGVRSVVEKRAQNQWPNEGADEVAVFVMVDRPREVGERFGATPVVDLGATNEPLLGRLFFMNRDASSGRGLPMPGGDPAAILEWLAEQGLGGRPIAIAYRSTKTMVVRRSGVDDFARSDEIRDVAPNATLAELLAALRHFHLNRLLIPSCCVDGVWETDRAAQYVPGPQSELSIQDGLEFALNFWFQGQVVAQIEDRTNIGRIDVRLLKQMTADTPLAYWAIVELKVIKSFSNAAVGNSPSPVSRAANLDAIEKGVRQAWAYRENRHAEEGLLEIYDLRRDKTEDLLAHADVLAAMAACQPVPHHNVRQVFGSADDARTASFSGV
jgi:hypothetical protein